MQRLSLSTFVLFICSVAFAQKTKFNGLDMNLGNLFRLSDAKTRSISPENPTGEPGKGGMATLENGNAKSAARDLGQGWKVNPFVVIKPGETYTIADIEAPASRAPHQPTRFSVTTQMVFESPAEDLGG